MFSQKDVQEEWSIMPCVIERNSRTEEVLVITVVQQWPWEVVLEAWLNGVKTAQQGTLFPVDCLGRAEDRRAASLTQERNLFYLKSFFLDKVSKSSLVLNSQSSYLSLPSARITACVSTSSCTCFFLSFPLNIREMEFFFFLILK
jgi:hypothetical protein